MLYKNLLQRYPVDTDDHFAKDRSSHKTPRDPPHWHNAPKMKWSVQNRCEPYHSFEIMASKNAISATASLKSLTVLITARKTTGKNRCCSDHRFRQGLCSSIAAKWKSKKFWQEAKFIVTEEHTQYNGHFARMMYVGIDASKERTHATCCWNNTSDSLLHM